MGDALPITRCGAPHEWVTGTPHRGAPGATSWARVESNALPHPAGRRAIARHIAGEALTDVGSWSQCSGRCDGMVAGRTDIGASQLVAFATRHPVQRHECKLQCEGRLVFDMVAGGTHERLRIHWSAARERQGQVVLLEHLGGGEPLSLFAWG